MAEFYAFYHDRPERKVSAPDRPSAVAIARNAGGELQEIKRIEDVTQKEVMDREERRALLDETILRQIQAMGPVSFESIKHEVKVQVPGDVPYWDISVRLNDFLRRGYVELYDTGDSFSPGPQRVPERYAKSLDRAIHRQMVHRKREKAKAARLSR